MSRHTAKNIKKLLTNFGWTMTLGKKTSGTYTPGTGMASASQNNYTITAIMLEYEEEEKKGTTIIENDRKCVIAADGLAVVPDSNDLVTDDDGTVYNIIKVKVIRKQDDYLAFICQVRV